MEACYKTFSTKFSFSAICTNTPILNSVESMSVNNITIYEIKLTLYFFAGLRYFFDSWINPV